MLDIDKFLTIALEEREVAELVQEHLPGWPGWWAAARAFAFLRAAPLRFPLPGAGCLAAEEVDKDSEDPVPGLVEGDVSRFPCCVLSYFSLVFVMEHSRRW